MSEQAAAVAFVVIAFLVAYVASSLLYNRLVLREQREAEEYMQRFVFPALERARNAGISQEALNVMWTQALDQSSEYLPPGRLFRDMIDAAIRESDGQP